MLKQIAFTSPTKVQGVPSRTLVSRPSFLHRISTAYLLPAVSKHGVGVSPSDFEFGSLLSLSDASTLDGGASLSHTWCRRLTDGHGAVPSLNHPSRSLQVWTCQLAVHCRVQTSLNDNPCRTSWQISNSHSVSVRTCISASVPRVATRLQFPAGPTERYHHSSLFSREGMFHQVTNESFLAVSICKNAMDGRRSTQRFCVSRASRAVMSSRMHALVSEGRRSCTMRLALQDTETCL